jgi:hypothetical protein
MLLEARPVARFSGTYTVHDFRGEIATIDVGELRECGDFTLDGEHYEIHAERPSSSAFVLEGPGGTLAKARRSVLRRWFEVDYDDRHLTVEPASILGHAYVVNDGLTQLGMVRRPILPLFGRRLEVELLPDLPLAVTIFLTWLVLAGAAVR